MTVAFDLQSGSGGLALNASAVCTQVVLDVYCRRQQLLGFEVYDATINQWSAPSAVALSSDNTSVVIKLFGNMTAAARVRYAYTDWPVVSLRNAVGGLPARVFDLAVEATSTAT